MAKYNFVIHTGDQYKAGTDSNIFVILHGERGISSEIRLNGYISGNAFERNKIDKFGIEFPDDYGDIYQINLRSDCKYSGSGWLLDYIYVQKENSPNQSKFMYSQWISDIQTKNIKVTSGFIKKVPSPKLKYTEVLGGTHFIPANTPFNFETYSYKYYGISYENINSFDSQTKVSVSIPIDILSASFEQNIGISIKETSSGDYKTEEKFTATYNVTSSQKARTLMEVWIVEDYEYDIVLGGTSFNIKETSARRFAGFIDAENGDLYENVTSNLPPTEDPDDSNDDVNIEEPILNKEIYFEQEFTIYIKDTAGNSLEEVKTFKNSYKKLIEDKPVEIIVNWNIEDKSNKSE